MGKNNHIMDNNNNSHRGHVQVGWSVRHCPSSYGRQQCSALPTHSSLLPPPTGQVASLIREVFETLNKGFKFGEITHSKCFIFFTFCQEVQFCLRFCCGAVVAQPFLYRETDSTEFCFVLVFPNKKCSFVLTVL